MCAPLLGFTSGSQISVSSQGALAGICVFVSDSDKAGEQLMNGLDQAASYDRTSNMPVTPRILVPVSRSMTGNESRVSCEYESLIHS